MPDRTFTYRVFNLTVQSELPFFDMPEVRGIPDVTIEYGQTPDMLINAVKKGVRYQASVNEFLLSVDNVARYYVTDGSRIRVERQAAATDEEILLFLMGSAFGALLHQRGILPLHSAAIKTSRGAVLFCGPSGIGKSTLVAALVKRGYAMLADDVSAVSLDSKGMPVLLPGFPRLKLWADALEKIAAGNHNFPSLRPSLEKFALPATAGFNGDPVPLHRLYIIQASHNNELKIEPLSGGTRKMQMLTRNTYRFQFMEAQGGRPHHFNHCLAIGKSVEIYKVARPKAGFHIDRLTDILVEHLAE